MIRQAQPRVGDVVMFTSARGINECPAKIIRATDEGVELQLPEGHPNGSEPFTMDPYSYGYMVGSGALQVVHGIGSPVFGKNLPPQG